MWPTLAIAADAPAPDKRPARDAAGTGSRFAPLRAAVEARLHELVPAEEAAPARLHGAVRHALLAPAKRLRPLLCLLAAPPSAPDIAFEPPGAPLSAVIDLACAVEMVHTASLVLDDLPCMDDAALRRGRPTTHRRFGEATAILAAIALMNRAFGVVAGLEGVSADTRAQLGAALSAAIGSEGLVAGQEMDLTGRDGLDADGVERLNWLKTGVLFVAAAELGAVAAAAGPRELEAVRAFATRLGQAFQTLDDVLDVAGSAETAGKDVNKDGGKTTLVTLGGREGALAAAADHVAAARAALTEAGLEDGELLALIDEAFPDAGALSGSGGRIPRPQPPLAGRDA